MNYEVIQIMESLIMDSWIKNYLKEISQHHGISTTSPAN